MRAFEALGDKKKFLSGICFSFSAKKSLVFAGIGTTGAYVPATSNHDSDRTDLSWLGNVPVAK
jgi:hypothetical protein